MFKKYGLLGIFLVIFAEINFFLRVEPYIYYGFVLAWFGYILTLDALVYKLKGNSLISRNFKQFLLMFILSAIFWWIFELINIPLQNWRYVGLEYFGELTPLIKTISFATVLPAFFETVDLLKSIHVFDKITLKKRKIGKNMILGMIALGVLCFISPLVLPRYTFPLVWLSFFLILDPINYMHSRPSILGHIKNGNASVILGLLLAGIILGFFWEFWNYWAAVKWVYDIPFLGFFKIFEMPILGYLGYFPFAFELYAMYWFSRSLISKN